AIVKWIETAVGLALSGSVAGVVTAPISKAPLYEAGFKFPGHTEFLGELTATERFEGARGPVMMLIAGGLRAALVTVHEPLAKAPGLLTIDSIVNVGLVTAQALKRDFGIASRGWLSPASIPTPAKAGPSGARRPRSSRRRSARWRIWGSTSPGRTRRTPCSPRPCVRATTPPSASITTRR